ncbi:uncharacterized protein LOC126736448 [Anthonomus grandis grandis]|uniref:uncharacterized protein LOC126736448 n=1 Tax=Anthonomus grandis grandis TaxID=2921223 RepID=UPI002165CD5D|nr:uncharacterized protein LOC126736448 [Anthonomus grandis grandis]
MDPTKMAYECYKPRKESLYISYCIALYTAVKEDIDTLLAQFTKKQTLNYVDFALVWQSMQMTCIFCDQKNLRALKVLCDVCFTLLKKGIFDHPDIYNKIGCFYLLYGLYYKQPLKDFVKIRLTLEEYRSLKALMQTMCDKGQYDALYIFAKMKSDEAFVFVAHPKPMAIVSGQKFDMPEETDNIVLQTFDRPVNSFKDIVKSENIQNLDETCKIYNAKMQELAKKYPSVSTFESSLVSEIKQEYDDLFGSLQVKSENEGNPKIDSTIMNIRQNIRKQAFKKKGDWLKKKLGCSSNNESSDGDNF